MPSHEPNENMDEALRAYAKKRREQAEPPLEMHRAARKLLQDEVKRTFSSTPAQTKSRRSWFSAWWPLGALGGAFAVVLLMFTVFHTSAPEPSSVSTLGVNKSTQEEKLDFLTRNPVVAPAPMERSLSEAKPAHIAAAPAADKANSSAPLASSVPPTESLPSVTPQTATTPAAALADNIAPTAAAPAVSSGAPGAPQGGQFSGAFRANARTFAPTAPAGGAATANDASVVNAGDFVQVHKSMRGRAPEVPPSNVLSAFNLSRAGQNVRVVDADGSIYNGQIIGEIPAGSATEAFAKNSQVANQDANWAFKVAGTNHNLQQNIVFTGNVLAMPVVAVAGQAAAQNRNTSNAQYAQSNGLAQSTQNSRITGKVQVGDGKEFKIEAKPPPP
jgi:hypothetical protein